MSRIDALKAIAYAPRQAGEAVADKFGRDSVDALLAEGLIETDPDWSGCYRATPAGKHRIAEFDEDED